MDYNQHTIPLLRAPHRMAFSAGIISLLILLTGWSLEMGLRLTGGTLSAQMPAMFAHGFLMLYGIFPFFFCGFLLTAAPRWLDVDQPGPVQYLGIPLLMLTGVIVWEAGLWLGRMWLLAGLLCYAAGFLGLAITLLQLLLQSRSARRNHARVVLAALVMGFAGLAACWLWLLTGDFTDWFIMRDLALWGCLLPVFFSVCHRMIPFFSANVLPDYQPWRPDWLLLALAGGAWLHGALNILAQPTWPLDALLALFCAYTSYRWRLFASLRIPLLAMLHLSFAWAGVGYALYAFQGAFQLYSLGSAPLHAFGLGLCLSMVIAFASRVTMGHSGTPLHAGRWLWLLFLIGGTLTLTRLITELTPLGWHTWLYLLTALGWLLCVLRWGVHFMPLLFKPRVDGKAG